MNFRNLTFFCYPTRFEGLFNTPTAEAFDQIADNLSDCRLKPVGPLELASAGFVPPLGNHGESLVHRQQDKAWITVGFETRLLPPGVINNELAKKLAEIEAREGRPPGGRTRKRIKEELITQLLPQAFVKPSRLDAYFDFGRSFIAVDTSSRRAAECVVSLVRQAAGSFPALPLSSEVAPRAVLTSWLSGEPLPDGLSLGDECELRDPADRGSVARFQNIELNGEDVQAHLAAGMQCTRLALTLDDHVSFVLGEDLVVRKFKLLDGAIESLESTERDNIVQELDARFVLLAGEVRRLFALLAKAFKFNRPDEDEPAVQEQQKFDAKGKKSKSKRATEKTR